MLKQGRIFKTRKERNYTQICNSILDRADLSWQSKGLLCYLLRLPDDWKVYKSQVQKNASNGRESFETAWAELEAKGYIRKGDQVKQKGKFKGNDYMVYEDPEPTETDAGNQHKPMRETSTGTDAGNPQLLILTNTTNTKTKKDTRSKEEREKEFYNSLVPFLPVYGKDMIRKFYDYWSEWDEEGGLMAWEIAKKKGKKRTFQLSKRLAQWKRNQAEFDKRSPHIQMPGQASEVALNPNSYRPA